MDYTIKDYTMQVESVKSELETLKEIAEELRDMWDERINNIECAIIATENYE